MGTKLTVPEAKRLAEYEATIHQGLDGWLDVCRALFAIHDKDLWIGKGKTFVAYCKAEFGIDKSRAYQLIDSGEAAKDVSTIVDLPPPRNEAVARELSKVKTEQERADLWTRSCKTSPTENPTAAHVAKTRRELFRSDGAPDVTPAAEPASEQLTANHEFTVQLDHASDTFRCLAEQDLTAVQRRLHVLRLEFEEKLRN